jgi:hypothetical protein
MSGARRFGDKCLRLADAPPAPMYARITFTGATGFDVGSEP